MVIRRFNLKSLFKVEIGVDKLFFEVLNKKLDGYNSIQTQEEILKAMNCTHNSLFHIWQRHDADKIFKSIKY
ncbi:hypothetical protein KTG68_12530 [Acinetobacter variabilis]|uniref:hypothetical protein n=1 Tax=Acinetobacter variabilis TaxID=70346 RepID=UPI0021D3B2BE|nr:hypothetical protein [Acinetobacter variabilis]MCU4312809.1 hypothetical protein [Acinetobacter variabilis]